MKKSCSDHEHKYVNGICTLCGQKNIHPAKIIHGQYVCEDCVKYVCSDSYMSETSVTENSETGTVPEDEF